ncbi:MAG: UDP-glucose 4-epimerase GalE [Bacteroidetes bacterium]|nr:UDP-glucose 4-epimerase GalE [Bacteroidota bacterium]MBS1630682.1 UDP-glucose 4-epimerase GalE [Bacteroidota bacterium]
MSKKILVTGGCGYIGSHTIVDLIQNGFEVISADDLSRGSLQYLEGIEKVTGKKVKNYQVDLKKMDYTEAIFFDNPDIVGIIHFAAFKAVGESVQEPLLYYENNLRALINVLQCAQRFGVFQFVFSSSCAVYGSVQELPVSEQGAQNQAQSPYGRSKQMCEDICRDVAKVWPEGNVALLRYFNPVGAHPSAQLGELQEVPENLVPVITQTAIGRRDSMSVYGNDYDTRDGSCIRDYVHVMDIAAAHTQALQYMLEADDEDNCLTLNLGTGKGVSVLELIAAFERVSGQKLNYQIGPRRAGDVPAVFANNDKAQRIIGWKPQYDLDAMMDTAWRWEKELAKQAKAAV